MTKAQNVDLKINIKYFEFVLFERFRKIAEK